MTATAASVRIKPRIQLSQALERVFGGLLLAILGIWVIANVAKDPTVFFQNVLTGLNNGAMYALIALGYTLVYGIIELINFAHGDLFMLGTILTAKIMVGSSGCKRPV